jgi:hypothetical protein
MSVIHIFFILDRTISLTFREGAQRFHDKVQAFVGPFSFL